MLEENQVPVYLKDNSVSLCFSPFEIKTLKVETGNYSYGFTGSICGGHSSQRYSFSIFFRAAPGVFLKIIGEVFIIVITYSYCNFICFFSDIF